jgi:hypothetical protein
VIANEERSGSAAAPFSVIRSSSTHGVGLLEVEDAVEWRGQLSSSTLTLYIFKVTYRSSSQTCGGGEKKKNSMSSLRIDAHNNYHSHIAKVSIKNLNISVDDLQRHQFIVVLSDSGHEK